MRKNESSEASNQSVANVRPNAIILFFLDLPARDTYGDGLVLRSFIKTTTHKTVINIAMHVATYETSSRII